MQKKITKTEISLNLVYLLIVFVVILVLLGSIGVLSREKNTSILHILKKSTEVIVDDVDNNSINSDRNKIVYEDENIPTPQKIVRLMKSENIQKNAFEYSSSLHEPGSERNEELGRQMAKEWKSYGMDKVEIFEYNVLLSFPQKPAEINLIENGILRKKLVVTNEPEYDDPKKDIPIYPYNAYSISGNVLGEVVFCNYGLYEDYRILIDLGVVLAEKIFIIRYGTQTDRGTLMKGAIKYGAIAVIFYSDPLDYTYPGEEYPDGWMLNTFGVQRGSIGTKATFKGELLSEGYPSKNEYYREKISRVTDYQFEIPSQPISAYLAAELFNFLIDDSIGLPKSFKGGLNATYALQSGKGRTIMLDVSNKLEDKRSLVVCSSIFGSTEPDRYIMIGNHRDAWTYGAADPVSGSAVMSEIVRVLGEYKLKQNYRPRRSIMACSWGAEEMGKLGSAEWADENVHFITQKVVAYLNVDMAVEGNYTVRLKSLDHMAKSIFEASKAILTPDNSSVTLFQDMCHKHAIMKEKKIDFKQPYYAPLGGSSDSAIFARRFGIAVSDYRYVYNKLDFPMLLSKNGQYHTRYDNYEWMSKFIDPSFSRHLVLGKLWLMHTLLLSDHVILPLDVKMYAVKLKEHFDTFEEEHREILDKNKVSLEFVKERIQKLILEATKFDTSLLNLDIENLDFYKLRAINDKLMNLGKQFIIRNDVGTTKALTQIMTDFNFKGISSAIKENNWVKVQKDLTVFVWCIDMAIESLDLSELRLDYNFNPISKVL